jgi:small subunit ribosomal protein S5
MEVGGVSDILSKSMGSRNPINTVKAVFNGLGNMLDAKSMAKNRGKSLVDLWG